MEEKGQMVRNICISTAISTILGIGFNQACVHFVLDQQGSHSIVNSCLRVGVFVLAGIVFGATLSLKETDQLQEDNEHEYEDNLVQNKYCFVEHAETKLVQKSEKPKEKKKVRGRLRMNRNQKFFESMQYINAHPEIFCLKS